MQLFKQNPFLAGIAAAAMLILGGGGYWIYSKAVQLSELEESLANKKSQLVRLQSNVPFPDENNVKKAREESAQAATLMEEIAAEFKVSAPELSPQGFQDELNRLVKALALKAAEKGVLLPEGFYLGFEAYEAQPPNADAASALGLQLRAIHAVAEILVESQVKSLGSISRLPLPQESVGTDTQSQPSNVGPGPDKDDVPMPAFTMAPFDVNFTADQSAFRLAFNRIMDIQPPLLVRNIALANSSPTPPTKVAPNQTEAGAEDGEAAGIKPVLGRESLVVDLRLASIATGTLKP